MKHEHGGWELYGIFIGCLLWVIIIGLILWLM
jgi:hypothetical protein